MSIVGGLVHTQSLPATAGADAPVREHSSPLANWLARHAWAIILSGTALFWLAVAVVVTILA